MALLMLLLGVASAVMFVPSLILVTELAGKDIRSSAMGAFNAAEPVITVVHGVAASRSPEATARAGSIVVKKMPVALAAL